MDQNRTGVSRLPQQINVGLPLSIMVFGGIVAILIGVDAEGRSLEDVATPLNAGGPRRGTTRAEGAGSPRAT